MLPEIIDRIVIISPHQKSNNNYKYIANITDYENNLDTFYNKFPNGTQILLGIMVNLYSYIQNEPEFIKYLIPKLDNLFSNRKAGKTYIKFSRLPNIILFNI